MLGGLTKVYMLFIRDRGFLQEIDRFFTLRRGVELPAHAGFTDGRLKRASIVDFGLWDRDIQPYVDRRAIGADWNWVSLFRRTSLVERALGRTVVGLQITVEGTDPFDGQRVRVPVAQQIVTVPYRWPKDPLKRCVFIWYLAGAPRAALAQFGVTNRFAVLPGLLSSAIAIANLNPYANGRVGLHADPGRSAQQGQELFDRYARVGMQPAPSGGRLSRARAQDGRMFYLDKDASDAHLARFPLLAIEDGIV